MSERETERKEETSPEPPLSALERKPTLEELLDLPTFTEVVRSFVDLYKIGVKVFDTQGKRLVDIGIGNGDFCGYVFSFLQGQRGCTGTVARVKNGPVAPTQGARLPLAADVPRGTVTMPCFTGLRYLIMPITYELDDLGRVVFGPFWPDDQKDLPEALRALGDDFDFEKAAGLLAKVRRAPEGTVAKVLGHFRTIIESLVVSGQKAHLTAQVHLEATRESYRELEEKNRALQATNERLKELDRLKSAFLATVSHELRTPLTSIIGYSEMLSEGLAGPMSPDQHEYVRIIRDKGENLLTLISSILDLTQIEAGRLRLLFEPTDIPEVVETSISSVLPQFQKKGVKLVSNLPAMPRRAGVDREKVRQTLVNLLSNALKFTPTGGQVTVALEPNTRIQGDEAFSVSVEDTGLGIALEHRQHIFETFFQVDNSSTREFGGAGLGLSIVKNFVEAHGGQVQLESEPGRGSRFTLVYPYTPRSVAAPRSPFG